MPYEHRISRQKIKTELENAYDAMSKAISIIEREKVSTDLMRRARDQVGYALEEYNKS